MTADNPGDRDIIDVTVPTVEDHLAEHREYLDFDGTGHTP
jgi:hypothetical protein